jgi:hypothetical protein
VIGITEVVDLLLKAGASPSVVTKQVIKPSAKLRQSNITTELFMNKDGSKTDETLHDQCIFKCRK